MDAKASDVHSSEPSDSQNRGAGFSLGINEEEEKAMRFRMERRRFERKRAARRRLELALWIATALSVYGIRLVDSWGRFPEMPLVIHALNNLSILMVAGFLVLFPLVFQLIFQAFPLELIRDNRHPEILRRDRFIRERSAFRAREKKSVDLPNVRAQLEGMAVASGKIAEKIYTRAGVYLLFGVLIAFSGLAFFYLQSQATLTSGFELGPIKAEGAQTVVKPVGTTPMEAFTNMAPRVGVLFFIELVAFFFLRQYRAAMDEYRYFEAIKRRREENLALVTMFLSGKGDELDFFPFVEKCSLYSDLPKLTAGETTEVLETRKLTKDEMALFEKMLDIVTKAKG
jgi:hypothetical protein